MVNFQRQPEDFVALSEREREVLQCIASGLSSKQCAQELGIAPRTVERHVENLRNKLNARNKPHLVANALAAGHNCARSGPAPILPLCQSNPLLWIAGDSPTAEQECA
jgi:LuxR family transcriptional regulator of spore coat protein